MKLAFIHNMRTGGSYALSLLSAAGVPLVCPFVRGLGRDWNRQELIQLASSEPEGVLHSHQIAWDEETVRWCKLYGWRTFTILRDPRDQIVSLWHFAGCEGDLDRFAGDLVEQRRPLGFAPHFWELPAWWREIDVLVPYDADLRGNLLSALGIDGQNQNLPEPGRVNGRPRVAELSADASALVQQSAAYDRYARALIRAVDGQQHCSAGEADCAALGQLVKNFGAATCLEVGSYLGTTAIALARAGAQRVFAIDTWQGALLSDGWRDDPLWGDRVYREFLFQTDAAGEAIARSCLPSTVYRLPASVTPLRGTSLDVAARWTLPLDLLFIDANHTYEAVQADIAAWWPHVKPRGILCGHDYGEWPGVTRAVDESGPVRRAGQSLWWRRK